MLTFPECTEQLFENLIKSIKCYLNEVYIFLIISSLYRQMKLLKHNQTKIDVVGMVLSM